MSAGRIAIPPALPLRLRTLGALALEAADGRALLTRRIDLAILTTLALRAPERVPREELQTLIWGERDESRARHSLRQVLLHLRQACGDALDVTPSSVRVSTAAMTVDVLEFSSAVKDERFADAVDLWNGPFLPSCEDIGVDEFRAWLEGRRERLRQQLALACARGTRDAITSGERMRSLELAERWARLFPLEEDAHLALIEQLSAHGRRADAIAEQTVFARRLQEEVGRPPSTAWMSATSAAIADAQETTPAAPAAPDPAPPAAEPRHATPTPSVAIAEPQPNRAPGRRWLVAAAAILVLLVGTFRTVKAKRAGTSLALGALTSTLPPDTIRAFRTLLTIDLARIDKVEIPSVEQGVASSNADPAALARASGAREFIDGIIAPRLHGVRADLRRVDARSGRTLNAYTIEALDLVELADAITERVARDLHLPVQVHRPEGTTGSLVAYALYEQGLRYFAAGNNPAAARAFAAALDEDSLFAKAAIYRAALSGSDSIDFHYRRAVHIADRSDDRDRLLARAMWAHHSKDPSALAIAETLVARYPSVVEGHLVYAYELVDRRNYPLSLVHFRHVIARDSAILRTGPACHACEALDGMMMVYERMDSASALESAARVAIRWQPTSSSAWWRLSQAFAKPRQFTEAHVALDSSVKYSADAGAAIEHSTYWYRTGEFDKIDAVWRSLLSSPKIEVRMDALWTGVISMRTQGRMREALQLARAFRRTSRDLPRDRPSNPDQPLLEAIVLMEDGHPRESAVLFDTIANRGGLAPTKEAAHRTMHFTFEASARALAGDTSALAWLEDTIRVNGARTTERYAVMHHYIRGLRLQARGRYAEAIAEFRQAMFDPAYIYVRILLEIGRSALAAGRPTDAIAALRQALDGPTSASGLYATRTELQVLLGDAFARAGMRDSAIAEYRAASGAWRSADRMFDDRRAELARRLATVSGH